MVVVMPGGGHAEKKTRQVTVYRVFAAHARVALPATISIYSLHLSLSKRLIEFFVMRSDGNPGPCAIPNFSPL